MQLSYANIDAIVVVATSSDHIMQKSVAISTDSSIIAIMASLLSLSIVPRKVKK